MSEAVRVRNQIFALSLVLQYRARPPRGVAEWPSTNVLKGLLDDLNKKLSELEGGNE